MRAGVMSKDRMEYAQPADELDIGALGRGLWRRRRIIALLTLVTAALAFTGVSMVTPRYRSEARVLIETRENIFLRPEAEKTLERNATVDQEAVTSQVQLILSRDLARDIVKKLKLGERPEFDPLLRGTSLVRVLLGFVGLGKDPMSQTPEERVLKSYFDRLSAFQVEKSRVIAIEFDSEDPELAAQAANAIAEGYLALQQQAKQEQTRSAGQWLAGEIENLRKKVADAEAKVEQYRAKANLLIGTNNTTLSNQQLGDFNAQLAAARGQKVDAEAKSRLIREALQSGGPIEFSDVINSELMRRLSEQRVTLRAQLAEQSSTLLDQHPRIKELRAQVADLERQMRAEAERFARALDNDAKLASAKLDSLSTSFDQLKRQAASTNEGDVALRALERDAKSQRDLLESYLAKYREASARDSISAASPDARIISGATVSNTPAWPKKLPTVLVAALGMLALCVGFVLTGELLSGAAMVPAGVPAAVPATVAPAAAGAAASSAVAVPPPPLLDEARASAGVALDTVERLARELGAAGEAGRRVALVGVRRNVGTTLTAITLARTLAKGARVVLVDLAFGAPNLSVIASDGGALGVADLVEGSASFGQIIARDRYSRAHVITAGHAAAEDHAAILSSQRLAITIEALGRSYDHVIIDGGALAELAAERLALLAPRAVLVADDSDGAATTAARDTLAAAGFTTISVLVGTPRGPQYDVAGARAAA
jgi:uncharacterized protein involved in exopolysaccharide biosynthesis